MKIQLAVLSVVIALNAISCTENNSPADKKPTAVLPEGLEGGGIAPSPHVVISSPGAQVADPAAAPAVVAKPVTPRTPTPNQSTLAVPKDAQWTIFCSVIGGAGHAERASVLKANLVAKTKADGRSQWYVIHSDTESTIYYGFYKDIDRKTADGQHAQADRAYLQMLADASGEHPLQQCYFLRLDGSEGEDIPQWNLANIARSDSQYWTLQVAAFNADKERRQAAVDAVKQFRSQGVQAYYYHGESTSSVTVGIWPMLAVREQFGGNLKGNAGSADPNQPLLVSDIPLSNRLSQPMTPDGRKMKAMSPKLEIVDPSLLAATRRYPEHAVNGYNIKRKVMNPNTGRPEEVLDPSFLALVPEAKASTLPGPSATDPAGTWTNALNDPSQQGNGQAQRPQVPLPGVGKLRSSGD